MSQVWSSAMGWPRVNIRRPKPQLGTHDIVCSWVSTRDCRLIQWNQLNFLFSWCFLLVWNCYLLTYPPSWIQLYLILQSEVVADTTSEFSPSLLALKDHWQFRCIYRKLLPRRPGHDSALEQYCTLYGATTEHTSPPNTLILTPLVNFDRLCHTTTLLFPTSHFDILPCIHQGCKLNLYPCFIRQQIQILDHTRHVWLC